MAVELRAEDPRLTPIKLRRELLTEGYNDRTIRGLVSGDQLVRVRHGAYVDASAWHSANDHERHGLQTRAVLRSADSELAVSHVSAACEWDAPLWQVDLSQSHVTRLDGKPGRRREAGVVQHVGSLAVDDITERNGVRVTSAARTAADCMTVLDVEQALLVVNHLLRSGHARLPEIHRRTKEMDSWPGTLEHRRVLRLACAATESPGEDRCLYLFSRQGLPAPVPQVEIRDPEGMAIARVDFAWPELGVFVEFDGKVKYLPDSNGGRSASEVVVAEKRREERICEITGWRCIRLVWSDLAHPERVAARIRAAFRR